jgi:hypothetical protein
LEALQADVVKRRHELEMRIMRLMLLEQQIEDGPNVRGPGGAKASGEFVMLKKKVAELVAANDDLRQQLAYKGKPPFGKFRSGVIEATKCLAKSEADAARFIETLNDSVQGYLDDRYDY